MKRCVIHIGMHKTGSTSIQKSLRGFADARHYYAELGAGPNHSLPVFSLFSANPGQHHLHRMAGRGPDRLDEYLACVRLQFQRSIEVAGERTLILSGEDIGHLDRAALVRLRDALAHHYDEIRVVGYVRPPAGFISSVFQERLKGIQISAVSLDLKYSNYRQRFGKLDEVFGRGQVELWKFSPEHLHERCAVQDFCRRLGLDFSASRVVRANESLSRQAVALLYTYRKCGADLGSWTMGGTEAARLGAVLGGRGRFRFAPEVVAPLLDRHADDIAWMEERLGETLREEPLDYQEGDVRGEEDLLRLDPAALAGLLESLGEACPAGLTGATAQDIALLVHGLRLKVQRPESSGTIRAELMQLIARRHAR